MSDKVEMKEDKTTFVFTSDIFAKRVNIPIKLLKETLEYIIYTIIYNRVEYLSLSSNDREIKSSLFLDEKELIYYDLNYIKELSESINNCYKDLLTEFTKLKNSQNKVLLINLKFYKEVKELSLIYTPTDKRIYLEVWRIPVVLSEFYTESQQNTTINNLKIFNNIFSMLKQDELLNENYVEIEVVKSIVEPLKEDEVKEGFLDIMYNAFSYIPSMKIFS